MLGHIHNRHTHSLFFQRLIGFVLLLSIPSLCLGMGLDFGGLGAESCAVADPPPPAPPGLGLTAVDMMVGLNDPVRVAVSSAGNVFVTDNKRGMVAVFDDSGKRIATLTDLQAPLGLAIFETGPLTPEPVPFQFKNCPKDKQENETLIAEYQAKLAKFEGLVDKHANLVAEFQAKLEQAAGNKRKERRYQRRIKQHTAKVARFESRVQAFKELLVTYDACNELWYDKVPLPLVYVGDEGDGSVKILDRWRVNTLGVGSGEFIKPNGIAVTADQTVYVVDSGTHQVKVYNSIGTLQTTFGGQGDADDEFNFPVDIVINEELGEVYVTDFWNERIGVFTLAGGWLRNIIAPNNDVGGCAFFRPSGLGIDPAGNLYVVDSALSAVVVMDNQGTLIDIIGYSNGQYWIGEIPKSLDAAADGQRVYVTLGQQGAVKVFEVTP